MKPAGIERAGAPGVPLCPPPARAGELPAEPAAITEREFRDLRAWIYRHAGIHLSDQKKALVSGRLAARLRHHRLPSYGEYFRLLSGAQDASEQQLAIDLLTTNETHFFREAAHFDFLRDRFAAAHTPARPLRVWSAACSSGEEPYSIAMTLAAALPPDSWEVFASDLSSRVLTRARAAQYPMARARTIPAQHLHDHCLKGTGRHEGTFMVAPQVASRVQFAQINLNEPLPRIGEFDAIFLRNVMIYFDGSTKQQVVERVAARLRRGGLLIVGHAESLSTLRTALKPVRPSIYRQPDPGAM
jgi:chemotaxis protein methyltransferase CheR